MGGAGGGRGLPPRRYRRALVASGGGVGGGPPGPARHDRLRDGVGQDGGLPLAGTLRGRRRQPGGKRARRDSPLPGTDQGAGRRSAHGRRGHGHSGGPARAVRRRHPDGRAPVGARSRRNRVHEPGHASPHPAARPSAVGAVLAGAEIRRRRRGAPLPRCLRQQRRARAAAAAAGRREVRRAADLRPRLGHRRRPSRHRPSAHGSRDARGRRRRLAAGRHAHRALGAAAVARRRRAGGTDPANPRGRGGRALGGPRGRGHTNARVRRLA